MSILQILQYIAVIGTILTGLVSLFLPKSITGFTGLNPEGGRGVTEIRAILGGVFIGLGVAVFILSTRAAHQTLGIMYLVVAAIRAVSMFIDQSVVQSNLISLVVEILFGAVLLL